jgi:crossover junction endonuclease MUS81
LHGIGSNIRQRLERCCQEAGLVLGDAQNLITDEQSAQQESEEQVPKRKKTTTPKEYVPSFRSGPYAMLLALYIGTIQSSSSKDYLGKSEIVTLGQPYCLAPMEEGMFSPLQGAIKTLTSKGLVDKQGIPARFKLTAEGSDLAARLWNSGERRSSAPLPVNEDIVPIERAKVDNHESIIESFVLPKDSFEIVLIVDTREVKSREERDFIINKLNDAGIRSEQRSLELGDFVWIARAKHGNSNQ